ncbi:sulfatase [Microbacterium sp. NPDC057659]|uniref:sulfatase family protein n=1 Tax=Microbacterium sp. NPDC057659 TaxID=3346198 RepID=UPI00366B2DD9
MTSGVRPNLLVVMADQLGAHVIDRDEGWVRTPNLERLRADCAEFERAYVTFPLCVPSRASFLTGRMPHELGIRGNRRGDLPAVEPGTRSDSLGHLLSGGGYDCAYAGKWHATAPSAPVDAGFDVVRSFGDRGLADACADWLRGRGGQDSPFLFIASFDDPHTICEYARRQPMPYGDVDAGDVRDAPPLPSNFPPAPSEPEAVRFEKQAAHQVYGTAEYTTEDWRRYRAAYRRLVERADAYLGRLLDALDEAGLTDSTLIVFTSDHGDGDAAHQWNQKTALFEECTRVPLIIAGPEVIPGVRSDPVSAGLDLLPTLLRAAGLALPGGLHGAPLPLEAVDAQHDRLIGAETRFERADPPLTRGRAIWWGDLKYAVYSWGRDREQLHDLRADPGERRNLAGEARFDGMRDEMRGRLLQWCLQTGDDEFLKFVPLPADAAASVHDEIFAVPY